LSSTDVWVRFLRNYGPIPTNDNMYDESIQRALRRHKIRPIALPTPLRDKIIETFRSDTPCSQIITGTAGDGKTYHCREVWTALGGQDDVWSRGEKVQTLRLGENDFIIVKDLSELKKVESDALLSDFVRDIANPASTRFYLLAANHGQLLEKLKSTPTSPALKHATKVIEDLLVTGSSSDAEIRLQLDDLSRLPASTMIREIIQAVTEHEGWADCENCSAHAGGKFCPIMENRKRLASNDENDPFKERMTSLIELSERNGSHFPIRQLLALVANCLLGHPNARDGLMMCRDVSDIQQSGQSDRASLYRNIFGENLPPRRAEKSDLFRKLNAFGIGAETSNQIDNLLVYGADDPAYAEDYAALVASDSAYGATPAYTAAQRRYLEGGEANERSAFLSDLKTQRQRLFFTLPEDKVATYDLWDLTVFRYAGLYLDVSKNMSANKPPPRTALQVLVRGLNRIFTGMLVQNDDQLVLATSGSYTQSKLSPLLDTLISVHRQSGEEVSILSDTDTGGISLVVRLVRDDDLKPLRLPLTPTRFEFLGRVAEGALPSSFSLECHEDLLAFKARLLRETEKRRKRDDDEQSPGEDVVLRFIELGPDGRALPRNVIVRA
jgi:hypothetical protein